MKYLVILLLLVSFYAWGENTSLNMNLPGMGQTYAYDRIRAGTFECQNAIGAASNVEFGVVGFLNNDDPYSQQYYNTYNQQDYSIPCMSPQDVGVYAKINIPIGGPKERINCNTLYELELEVKRMEVIKLKQEISNLRNLQFIDSIERPTPIKED